MIYLRAHAILLVRLEARVHRKQMSQISSGDEMIGWLLHVVLMSRVPIDVRLRYVRELLCIHIVRTMLDRNVSTKSNREPKRSVQNSEEIPMI